MNRVSDPGAIAPEVSVLMGVFNAQETLDETLDSVLDQEDIELELIAVDDGSTDGSGKILDRRAGRDPRVIVVHQANAGLTTSLQRAARLARGRFYARQDAGGDRSLPGRLAAQARMLRERSDLAFVTCGHRYFDEENIFLCEVVPSEAEIGVGLSTLRVPGVRGIMHASSMFRASTFWEVGGYRETFIVAQDIDLWLRLHEKGGFGAVPAALYDCRFEPNGTSSSRHSSQLAFADLAVRCAVARRLGVSEPPLVTQELVYTEVVPLHQRMSNYHYFVACCLRARDPQRARRHYLKAWWSQPLRLKALFGAMMSW